MQISRIAHPDDSKVYPTKEDATRPISPMSVLLVDDDPVMRLIATSWLSGRADCRVVAEALQALAAVHEQAWDVFFVDLNLGGYEPEGNGLDLVRTLQQLQPQAAWVLMTAHGAQGEFSRAVNLGVDHILLKPFRREAFLRTLEKIDQARQTRETLRLTRQALERQNLELQTLREQEQRIAALAQKYLLFYVPEHEVRGLHISSAAKAQEGASGDLVDVLNTSRGLSVVSGDVMGKGLGAAIVSAGIKTALSQVRLSEAAATPAALLESVRQKIAPMLLESESLLTLMVAEIDTQAGQLSFVDCGSPYVFLQRGSTGDVVFACGDMMPLGIRYEPIQSVEIPLMQGDRLLFLSDGVLDALGVGDASEAYGQVARQLMECPPGNESELVNALVQQVCKQGGIEDDRSCVLVVYNASSPAERHFQLRHFSFHLDSLAELREWIRGLLQGSVHECMQAPWLALCQLGVTEVASNIFRHARLDDGSFQRLSVRVFMDTHGLWIEWHYQGKIFRPSHSALRSAPKPEALAQSGYGMSIIHSAFERVHYFTGVAHSQSILTYKAWG
jgi:serine phosphatase RsbU (regulator of sigma subunit)/anti-sigma regulatory factor (Ser/Thr protein kinase)